MPKVSVLIPLYNCFNYIEQAIASVLDQTFKDLELIIVDNCSTDGSYELIQKYKSDDRVKIFQNEVNIGMARNWNQCLLYATGEYIKYLCADDYFRPDMLASYVEIMDGNKRISLVSAARTVLTNGQELKLDANFVGLLDGKEVCKKIISGLAKTSFNPIGEPTTVMFRRRMLYIGMFNIDMLWLTDIDYWLRLCNEGDVYFFENSYSVLRLHSDQASNTFNSKNKFFFEERDFMYYNIFIRNTQLKYDSSKYFGLVETHLKNNLKNTDRKSLGKYLGPMMFFKTMKFFLKKTIRP